LPTYKHRITRGRQQKRLKEGVKEAHFGLGRLLRRSSKSKEGYGSR
jgi:hypothetical protein